MLLIDTRDKPDKIKHITDYLDRNKIPYDRTKLYIGDYQRADNPLVLIDRKQNLLEMANNATQGHERFKRELERLTAINGKMYILIEENLDSLEDVQKWKSPVKKDGTPYTKLQGRTLYKIMLSWQHRHNIEFVFCHKNGTAKKILELLEVDARGADKH